MRCCTNLQTNNRCIDALNLYKDDAGQFEAKAKEVYDSNEITDGDEEMKDAESNA